MERDRLPCARPVPETAAAERDRFERVWRRVMPEDRPDCPFTLYSEETEWEEDVLTPPAAGASTPQARAAAEQARPAMEQARAGVELACPAETRTAPQGLIPVARREDPVVLPQENDVPCLGSASARHGRELQEFIEAEAADWRLYEGLSRRIGGAPSRTLRAMAEDERRHARRLSTAYFLISGIRFQPERQAVAPTGTFLGTLRLRFAAEQRGEAAYRAAAEATTDPCLRELYLELAGDEAEHVWLLRGILEQL